MSAGAWPSTHTWDMRFFKRSCCLSSWLVCGCCKALRSAFRAFFRPLPASLSCGSFAWLISFTRLASGAKLLSVLLLAESPKSCKAVQIRKHGLWVADSKCAVMLTFSRLQWFSQTKHGETTFHASLIIDSEHLRVLRPALWSQQRARAKEVDIPTSPQSCSVLQSLMLPSLINWISLYVAVNPSKLHCHSKFFFPQWAKTHTSWRPSNRSLDGSDVSCSLRTEIMLSWPCGSQGKLQTADWRVCGDSRCRSVIQDTGS